MQFMKNEKGKAYFVQKRPGEVDYGEGRQKEGILSEWN